VSGGRGPDVGRVGVFSGAFRSKTMGAAGPDAARAVEGMGWPAIWYGGARDGEDLFLDAAAILAATDRASVGVGVMNVWAMPAERAAAAFAEVDGAHPGRFLLGLGVSHPESINRDGDHRYRRPLGTMGEYLDTIDRSPTPVPLQQRVLAALGPRMLELAGTRARGALPYFVPVEHTAFARDVLGPGPLLAPEQAIVLEPDPHRARDVARRHMTTYLGLSNYTNNLRRFGFTDDDLAAEGSDRLVDAVIAWGDASAIADRVRSHLDAGADHVALQLLRDTAGPLPLEPLQELAAALRSV
jgi:probable F420-dependent oxidoreductase